MINAIDFFMVLVPPLSLNVFCCLVFRDAGISEALFVWERAQFNRVAAICKVEPNLGATCTSPPATRNPAGKAGYTRCVTIEQAGADGSV